MKTRTFAAFALLLSWSIVSIAAQHEGHGGMSGMNHPGMDRPDTPQIKTGSFKSRVIEIGQGTMVVEGKYQGKVQRMTVMTDARTKIERQVQTGSEVTVRYREDAPGTLYATAVKGPKPKKS
ncbi:MAG: hypothetical protein IT282_11730 [Bacteroidetes bacterium]|nr:hypothetical protein [Bacteroidota bacterium]